MGLLVAHRQSFTCVTAKGRVSAADLAETISALSRNDELERGACMLWDLRAARLGEISGLQLRRLVSLVASKSDACRAGCAAILVGDDAGFGVGRMWEILTEDDLPLKSRVFRSEPEAEAWLEMRRPASSL